MNKYQLEEKIKSIKWFPSYQSFSDLDIKGLRDSDSRFSFIDKNDIQEKTVIDYGCNLGQACVIVKKMGAGDVFGCDCQKEVIDIAKEIVEYLGLDIKYDQVDFNDKNFNDKILKLSEGGYKSDVALFLSVYGTLELKDREGLFKTLLDNTKSTVYFEGHNKEKSEKYSKIFLKEKFNINNFSFLAYLKDSDRDDASVRPFFVIKHRDKIKVEDVLNLIKKETHSRKEKKVIAIEGAAGSGKTTLLKFLKSKLVNDQFIFIDDLLDLDTGEKFLIPHNKMFFLNWLKRKKNSKFLLDFVNNTEKNIIISDYRIRKYLPKSDILFRADVKFDERISRLKKRFNNEKKIPKSFLKKRNIYSDNFFCRSFYTVDTSNYEK